MPNVVSIEELKQSEGTQLKPSSWMTIDQERVNQFADATGDHQFIHVDPERAEPIFGGTIAHGYLTLSLSVHLLSEHMLEPEGHKQWINYGLNKVRFVAPVLTGSKVRLQTKVTSVTEKKPGIWLLGYEITMEIEGGEKPAYVAEFLMMSVTETAS